jgi:hypothetical protein
LHRRLSSCFAIGGLFFYAKVINDSPSALDKSDLDDALVPDSLPDDTTSNSSASTDTVRASSENFDGEWLVTDASEFGYRVQEVLAGLDSTAVGRSNADAEVSRFVVIGVDPRRHPSNGILVDDRCRRLTVRGVVRGWRPSP